jgi:hypothetical protein
MDKRTKKRKRDWMALPDGSWMAVTGKTDSVSVRDMAIEPDVDMHPV